MKIRRQREDTLYKIGDPAPEGYLQWHAWAQVQHKGGYIQEQCSFCGLWIFPQENCKCQGNDTLGIPKKEILP